MMEVRVTQGFQTWRVLSANDVGLVLELAGRGRAFAGPGLGRGWA
jgi:hypothetical protein